MAWWYVWPSFSMKRFFHIPNHLIFGNFYNSRVLQTSKCYILPRFVMNSWWMIEGTPCLDEIESVFQICTLANVGNLLLIFSPSSKILSQYLTKVGTIVKQDAMAKNIWSFSQNSTPAICSEFLILWSVCIQIKRTVKECEFPADWWLLVAIHCSWK